MKTRFALYNSCGQYINDYNKFPVFSKNINDETCDYAARQFCFTDPNPDLSKFVSLTYIGGIIEVFNVKNDAINKIVEKRYLDPDLRNSKSEVSVLKDNTNIGFCGLYTTDNYIYASYSGLKLGEFKNKFLADYVTVFDWNGEIKKLYRVEGGLLDLAVDETLNRIYIITKNSEGEDVVGFFNI